MSLFVGLLLLEEGDVDNALSCFKNGQIADSDTTEEQFQSDYALLQLLEARCYQMRGEYTKCGTFSRKAANSFATTHPSFHEKCRHPLSASPTPDASSDGDVQMHEIREVEVAQTLARNYSSYYAPLMQPYNTLLLVWTGRSPTMQRTGQYGEQRAMVRNPSMETHYEVQVDNSQWYDVVRGFANISYPSIESDDHFFSASENKSIYFTLLKTLLICSPNMSYPPYPNMSYPLAQI